MDNNNSSRNITSGSGSRGSRFTQIYTALCVNLLTLSWGCSVGWYSPALEILKLQNSPLASGPITIEESAIVGSSACLGGFFSSCIYGWITEKYGRKRALISCAIPQMLGWIVVYFAQNYYHLIISRLLHGIAGGGIFIVIPLFVTEISEDSIRGFLGTILIICLNSGILLGYLIGDIVSWESQPLVYLTISYIFFAGSFIIHDSPYYLLQRSRFKRAENALKFYRGCSSVKEMSSRVRQEYDNMTCLIKISNCDSSNGKITLSEFFTRRPVRKSLIIGLALMSLNLFSGVFLLIAYASMIFNEAGSSLTPNKSALIVGGCQLIGSCISTLLVEKLGRRLLVISSALNCSLGLSMFGAYDYSKYFGIDIISYNWIPIVCVCFIIFTANLGAVSLPFLIVSEISPMKVVYSIVLSYSWILAFLFAQFLPSSMELLGLYGTLFILALCCVVGAVFVFFYVPETKNRSIEEIQEVMAK